MPDILGEAGTSATGTTVPNRAVPLSGWFSAAKSASISGLQGTGSVGYLSYVASGSYDWLLVDNADRLYPWKDYCGIPGGIPTRTTVYRSFTSADSMATINAAIAVCPTGQVVQLAAGAYAGTLSISAANPCTVRGAGAGQTIINGQIFFVGSWITPNADSWSYRAAIASGYTRGSTSITLSSAPPASVAIGNLITITQNDDYDLVWQRNTNYAGTKNLRFTSRITNVVGNVVTLATPIPYTYSAALSPVCVAYQRYNTLVGAERMTVNGSVPLEMDGADRCWVKDMEITGFANQGYYAYNSSQCEINRCYFHDCAGFPSSDGYWILLQYGNSCFKVEDNIAYRCMAMVFNGAAANYVGFNDTVDMRRTTQPLNQEGFNSNHGPHSIMNLWEGNISQRFVNDGYHGSGSHDMIFRNHFHGINPYTGWVNERRLIDLVRGAYYESVIGNVIGHSSYTPTRYQAGPLALGHDQSACYVLGWGTSGSGDPGYDTTFFTNWCPVLAGSSATTIYIATSKHLYPTGYYVGTYCCNTTRLAAGLTPAFALITGFTYDDGTGRAVINLSGAGITGTAPGDSIMVGPERYVETTLLRHGNYDYFNNSQIWDGSITGRGIPDSLFYDSKPTWFGSLSWPPVNPVGPTVTDIPAKHRWDAYVISGTLSDLFADAT